MPAAPLPKNEAQRLARLRAYRILDTPPEDAFDRIVRIAANVLDTPIALVSLVDQGRQWFKAKIGLDARETPRDLAFCAHAILSDEVLVVPDATQHATFADNPLINCAPNIRFYAGAPLTTHDGLKLGTVCVIDDKPHAPSPRQIALLRDLSALAMDELELRAAGKLALEEVEERKRIDAFKTAFISTINHEIRTPLTSIIGGLELVNGGMLGEVPPHMGEVLTIAERNAALLLRLINELLDTAALEAGQMEFNPRPMDLTAMIEESMENLRSYCREKRITVSREGASGITVNGDKARLTQVLNNLISNGVKFSPPGSDIRIGVTTEGGRATVSVSDTGGGIPESIRPRIFGKFVQGHAAGKGEGTGLGLSIVKAIVERHGGEIGFETETGSGTRFHFTLPTL
ncbi:MAG: GAF domain-containing sensor histidine kinase [Rhodospirillaceae bacterium]|nr:GAF domain-containing sensor histidine kinase [Rhodospirillaceae bacterium]